VPDELKRERAERVQELQRLITEERYEAMLGRTVRAMVDAPAQGGRHAEARTDAQADDIDGVTWIDTDAPPGTILDVRLDAVEESYDFVATALGVRDEVPVAGQARRPLPVVGASVGSYGRRAPA
jgi:tRNA A37 methylthiotransferase MiaB